MVRRNSQSKGRTAGPGIAAGVGIAASGLVLVAVAAAAAWLIGDAIRPATAQRVAATHPQPVVDGVPPEPRGALGDARARIARLVFAPGQPTLVEGEAAPLSIVALSRNGESVGEAATGVDGMWRLTVEQGMPPGDHRLWVESRPFRRGGVTRSETVRVSVPLGLASRVTLEVDTIAAGPQSANTQKQVGERRTSSDEATAVATIRIAQAPAPSVLDTATGALRDWIDRADRNYRDVIVKRLTDGERAASPAPPIVVAQQTVPPASDKPGMVTAPSWFDPVLQWLKRSSDVYQRSIVKRLVVPNEPQAQIEARARDEQSRKTADEKAGAEAQQRARDERRAAEARGGGPVAQTPSPATQAPPPPAVVTPDPARQQAEQALRAAQAQRDAELKAAEAAAKKPAAPVEPPKAVAQSPAPAQDEAARRARQAEIEAAAQKQRLADEARLAEERARVTARQIAEQQAGQAKQAAEAKAKADAVAKTAADDATRKRAEEQRLAAEIAAKAAAAAEAARREFDARRVAEEAAAVQRKAADRKAAEDTRRRAQQLAEAASRVQVPQQQLPAIPKTPSRAKPTPPAVVDGTARIAGKPQPVGRSERVATVVPPARRGPPIEMHSRSSLGAGRQAAAMRVTKPASREDARDESQCRGAGRRIKPPGYYIVKDGDSLWDIADLHYDDGAYFGRIERANRRLGDPDLIKPCQRLYIPGAPRG